MANQYQPDVIMHAPSSEIHPRGLLEAVSYIDQNFANELGGCMTHSRFLTTKQRIEFMEVGFRSAFVSGLVSALLSPIAIGVIERYIPMFGSDAPNMMDQISSVLLALCFSIGYALFLARSATSYIGEYTRAMVRNLLGGMVLGALLKAFIAFLAYHAIYLFVFSDGNILRMTSRLYSVHMGRDAVAGMYWWIRGFRQIFLTSAYFVVVSTLIFILIPFAAYVWAGFRNRRLVAAGVVKLEAKPF